MADGSTAVRVEATNIGRKAGSAVVYETIPAGMEASGFSPEPFDEVVGDDGSVTYAWQVELEGAVDTDSDTQTIYDTATLGYNLSISEQACSVRSRTPEPVVQWDDASGVTRQAMGSPLIIECW